MYASIGVFFLEPNRFLWVEISFIRGNCSCLVREFCSRPCINVLRENLLNRENPRILRIIRTIHDIEKYYLHGFCYYGLLNFEVNKYS